MSLDRSLKIKNALTRHRNVLTRAERIDKLKDEDKWSEGDSLTGLPKVGHRKARAGKKDVLEKGKAEGAEGAEAAPKAAEASKS